MVKRGKRIRYLESQFNHFQLKELQRGTLERLQSRNGEYNINNLLDCYLESLEQNYQEKQNKELNKKEDKR